MCDAEYIESLPRRAHNNQDSMQHPYIKDPDYPEEEPTGPRVDWKWDAFEPTKALLQKYVYEEAARFHPEVLGNP